MAASTPPEPDADSSADDEYRECLLKARPLIRALNATLSEGPGPPVTGRPASGPAAIPPSLRPRPAVGVFTSLRVTGGHGHDLDQHLARLDDSTWQLFGKHLPPSLPTDLALCLSNGPSGRLRLTARPFGGPLRVTVEVIPASAAPETVDLRPVTVPGGLGVHKWLDRRLLARLAGVQSPGPDEHLLIQDRDGEVLETDRANVFAVIDGVLHTPPADGRLLPGVTRAAVLRIARGEGIPTREVPVPGCRLLDASEVFITNSVQGVVPVRSLSGTSLTSTGLTSTGLTSTGLTGTGATWKAGPIAGRLQAALARRPASAASLAGADFPAAARSLAGARPPAAGPVPRSRPGRVPLGRAGRACPAIVLVDNYDSFTYNLAHLLLSHGGQVEVVRNDEVSARDIADFSPGGIVISPGPGTPADAGISIDTARACAATIPLLGICLGHQALAAAHGAGIATAPQPVHGQASLVSHDGGGVLSGLPSRFPAARYHSLIVDEESLPPGLVITARGPGGIPMGLRHTRHPAEGLQFHPESILTAHGHDIIRNFVRAVRAQARETGAAQPPTGH